MATWPTVKGVENGQNVDEATFNRPIAELAERTDYLKRRLDALTGLDSVRSEIRLSPDETFHVGDIVCVNPETKLYTKAIASMSLYDAYTASVKAYAVGILVRVDGAAGTVCLYGKVELDSLNVSMPDLMEAGETFRNGEYYLSSTTAGKITRHPKGPRILVGFFCKKEAVSGDHSGDFALINPQHMDIEAHSHRTYVLTPRPAGEVYAEYEDESNGIISGYRVIGFRPDDGTEVAPRMTICGDWTTSLYASYTVTLDDGVGNTPTSWPCRLTWVCEDDSDRGTGTVDVKFFGDEVAVGTLGLAVRFDPYPSGSLDRPFPEDYDGGRVWTANRDLGRGWAAASVNRVESFDGSYVRLTGVSPEKTITHAYFCIPYHIYDLTSIFQDGITAGMTLSLGGEDFVFVNEEYEYSGTAKVVYIADDENIFDTLVALAEKSDMAVMYNVQEKQVLFGDIEGDEVVTVNGLTAQPRFTEQGLGLLFDMQSKESLAVPISIGREFYSVIAPAAWTTFDVEHGFSLSFMGDTPPSGSYFQFDANNGCPGSVYRYAVEFDNDLKKHFPPVPAKSGSLMLNGVELEPYEQYGEESVFGIGDDSIYWRDPSYGRAPWPTECSDRNSTVDVEDEYRILFHFVSEFHSETGPVTSLRPAEGSPIKVYRCGTDEDATVGDLSLDVKLEFDASDSGESGYKVVKRTRGNRLLLGPVVERIIAGPGISISNETGQGTVTISADGTEYNGDFETVALENAKLESVGMFPYIRFLKWSDSGSNIPTGFVAKFHLPATAHDAVYRVKFYATVFGEESFSNQTSPMTAGVAMDYNILPDFSMDGSDPTTANLKTGLIKPNKEAVLDIPFGVQTGQNSYDYSAFDPILIHNDSTIADEAGVSQQVYDASFPNKTDCSEYVAAHSITWAFGIRPGYTVAIRFSRTDPSTGVPYEYPIGFLNLRWRVEEVATVDAVREGYLDDLVTRTVVNLRKAAKSSGPMTNSYEVVDVIQKILNALK
jgi:hypothetical protein